MALKLRNNLEKKIFIKTFGCQMNEYDSERIYDFAKKIDYKKTNNLSETDCYVLNTCHIREKASEKMYSDIGRLSIMKQNRKKYGNDLKIVIAGCVAQAEGKEILNRNRDVDIVVGPQTYHKLPELLKRNEKLVLNDFPNESKFKW